MGKAGGDRVGVNVTRVIPSKVRKGGSQMGISSRRLSLAVLFLLTHAIAMMTSAVEPIYLRPTDDATVVESHPNTNYGADPTLQVDLQDSEGGEEWSYLKFVIGSVAGNIGRARLRLAVVAPSSNTADVYKTLNTSWNEESITWSHSTRPGLSTFVTSIGNTTMNQVIYMDVTNHVAPNSVVTFALKPRSIDTANFASKEHATARRPSLILDNISACIPSSSTPTAFNYCSTASPLLLQTQSPTDVSIQMSAASGVTITQLTDNVANMIAYYDIPAVVAGSNRFVYSAAPPSGTLYTATMRLDGTDEKLLTSSPESSQSTFLTPDGSMAYFPRKNLSTNRMDIKAINLHGTTCAESTIAQNFLRPEDDYVTQLSPASRSCAIDKWVIAVATRARVFRYKGKGGGSGNTLGLHG